MRLKYFFKALLMLFLLMQNMTYVSVGAESKSLCVFDLLGANGPIYAQMEDYKIAAMGWGVDLRLKPYNDESKAAIDFKSGVCDAVSFTGIQSRQFNLFTGSLDAMGALPSYEHLRVLITAISTEQAAPLMLNPPYEVAGIIPIGSAYLYINDRALVSQYAGPDQQLAKIRVAVMESDPAQIALMKQIGASFSMTSIANMYQQFNNAEVDATYGPAVVYQAMELDKGMGLMGGVIRFPLAQLSLQIIIHHQRFPADFAKNSRLYALKQFDKAVSLARNYEQRIPPYRWISITEAERQRYLDSYRKSRKLLAEKGVYDSRMLRLMQRIRCKKNPQAGECQTGEAK